jgi:hypothetical protein
MKNRLYTSLVVLVNYYTALYLITGAAILVSGDFNPVSTLWFLLVWIYLLPPLLCRLLILLLGKPSGTVSLASPTFIYWWFLTQLEILFARFAFLEELLRILPGVYNLWLNLWGGRVNLFAYWSPGVTVTDRYLLSIGRGVVLGGGCRIGAHIIVHRPDGTQRLTLAGVTIDEHSVVGVHAAIGPGCHVHAHETVPAGKILKPFYTWKDGSVHRPQADA